MVCDGLMRGEQRRFVRYYSGVRSLLSEAAGKRDVEERFGAKRAVCD